jgi:hypothetical protein
MTTNKLSITKFLSKIPPLRSPDNCSEVVAKVKDVIAAFCIETILSVGLRTRNSRAVDSHEVE